MVNWKKLKNNIPHRVQTGRNNFMEILYTQDFKDGQTLGEMRPDSNQIVIKNDQSPKNTVTTYLHEILHSISEETGAKLTENQILALEKAFYYILKPNNIFREKK